MNIKQLFLGLTGVLLLAACSSADEEQPQAVTGEPQSGIPIMLTSVVDGPTTRAGSSIQGNALLSGELVNVYITAPNGGATYDPKVYKINTGGEMSPVGNIFPYFPTNGNSIKVTALYPQTVTSDTRTFTVESNQDKQVQYKLSDLMFGTILDDDGVSSKEVAPTDVKQTITFRHKLSKITVILKSGTGSPDTKNSEVQLCNVYKTIGFTPASGALGALSGDPDYVTMTTDGRSSSGVSAIIPPQSIGTGYFLKIRLAGKSDTDSGDIIYYSPSQSFDVESGKEYKFTMTINQNGLTVDYTVSDWLNTQDDLGNANNVYTGQTEFPAASGE